MAPSLCPQGLAVIHWGKKGHNCFNMYNVTEEYRDLPRQEVGESEIELFFADINEDSFIHLKSHEIGQDMWTLELWWVTFADDDSTRQLPSASRVGLSELRMGESKDYHDSYSDIEEIDYREWIHTA
ncbi:hypothetical protein RHSIM_Rhsim04G0038400 [Rhododendron simsii]|uniref:Uncharacterized protein n=1 Tax=Rhododendron simsii TaxID=118357 RepID=A0A834H532_RHOSS|nr:hypothetical protein RHSIM_Rhsim04G0038400 [Rhododendron simsii]